MSNWIAGRYVPTGVPGDSLTRDDMSRVNADDWADLRNLSRRYCAVVDSTRSRKRKDGSATVTRNGQGLYGTDDVSDDVTQDAVLIFATRLRDVISTCAVSSMCLDTREPASWLYIRKDGQEVTVTRTTLQRWAVRDAAARNGYRLDVPPDETDQTPGQQVMRGLPHAENIASLATTTAASQLSETIFRTAWGDGGDFPTLSQVLFHASEADDLGRAGIWATVAQARHGGAYGSRRQVRRTQDAAAVEWDALSARLDESRDELIYHAARSAGTA